MVKPDAKLEEDTTIQTEYFIKYSELAHALEQLHEHRHHFQDALAISEVRMVSTDSIPRSSFNKGYHGDEDIAVGIHFTWKSDTL